MIANNNLKVCRKLVWRDFRFHKTKNILLILATALVTGLYGFVFLLGNSVEEAYLLNYQYSYGSTSHILYTGLTNHQADSLAGNAMVKSTVRLSTVGVLSDEMIGQRSVKLAVTDRDYAETVLSVPTSGRLPRQVGEIALDEFTMDSLGILHELGTKFSLSWTDPDGQSRTDEFTLCGWWASPTNFAEACAWITAETAQELVPGYDGDAARNVTLGVNLHQPRELDVQAQQILDEQGVSGGSFTTNLAYNDARREQVESLALPFYLPALLVLVCGFLMIYSIVHVAWDRDMQFFASLKGLGMTPRQIRQILLEQGCVVVLLGVLPGSLVGFVLHLAVTGRIVTGFEGNAALYFVSWQPFLMAAFCTLATALLAYLVPAWKLARMTPAETLRYTEDKLPKRSSEKRKGRTTLPVLALRSLMRGRAHVLLSTVSLLIATVLLSAVWMQYVSYREEMYLSALSPWDYTISDGSAYLSVQWYNESSQAITEKTVEDLESRPEVREVSRLKSREVPLKADETLRQRIVDFYNQPYDDTQSLRDTQAAFPEWCKGLDRLEETGEYTGLVIGLEGDYLDYVLENCPFTSGSFDADKFSEGKYVLASGAYHEGISTPAAGETIEIGGEELEVLGAVMTDDAYLSGSNSAEAAFNIIYYVPLELFDRLFPGQGYRQLAVNIDHSLQGSFETYLDDYEQGLNRGVGITRRSEYQASFESARLNEVLPELIVSLVLLAIGMLNFINMLVVKAVSRKKEFAVYESLGMTGNQLRRLLLMEGVFHAVFMAVTVGVLTFLLTWFGMPVLFAGMDSWCMVYTYTLMPLWLALLFLLLLAVAVPLLCLRFLARGSITERLRAAE